MPRLLSALLVLCPVLCLAQDDRRVHEESGLEYAVVRPTNWDGETPVDMLLVLHGSGGKLGDYQRVSSILVPEFRRLLRVYVQSPDAVGWPVSACEGLGAIARVVEQELPVRRVILWGFSAGGWVGTQCLFDNPDVIDGALVSGATLYRTPPRDEAVKQRYLFFSLGKDDPMWEEMGVAPDDRVPQELLRHFEGSGWDLSHVRVDVVEGVGHTLIRANLVEGLDWLLTRLRAQAPALSEAEQAKLAEVEGWVEAGELEPIRQRVAELLPRPGSAARETLYPHLERLAGRRDPELAGAGARLLARLGDPRAAALLTGRLERARRQDDGLYLATIEALGAFPGEAVETALLRVVKRWEDDGAAQVAAARALAFAGGDESLKPLVSVLKKAERDDARAELAAAINAALQELTGQRLEGARLWRAYLREAR